MEESQIEKMRKLEIEKLRVEDKMKLKMQKVRLDAELEKMKVVKGETETEQQPVLERWKEKRRETERISNGRMRKTCYINNGI